MGSNARELVPYRQQSYEQLQRECLARQELFVDAEFPPHNKSLFYSRVEHEIEWRRPRELAPRPALVVNGISADDLNEGELGNTWFVSACAWLTKFPELFYRVRQSSTDQQVLMSLTK